MQKCYLKRVAPHLSLEHNVIIISLASFALFLGIYIWLQLLPIYLDNIGLTPVLIGIAVIGESTAISIMSLPSGMFSDMIGRKVPIVVGSGLIAIATLLLYFTVNPIVVILLVILVGVFTGLTQPAVVAIIAESARSKRSGVAYGIYYFSTVIAMVIGSALSGILADTLGFPILFIIGAIATAFAFIILYLFVQETVARKRCSHCFAIKRSVLRSIPTTVSLLKNSRELVLLTLALSIHMIGFSILVPYLPLYATYGIHLDIKQTGVLMAVWHAGFLLSQIPSGIMADRLGSRLTLLWHFLLSSVTWVIYPLSHSFAYAAVALILAGMIGAMDMPARRVITIEYSADSEKATVIGALDFIVGIVPIFAPFVGGFLWEKVGYSAPFFAGAVITMLACIPMLELHQKKKHAHIK